MRDKLLEIIDRSTEIIDWENPILTFQVGGLKVKTQTFNCSENSMFNECTNVYIYCLDYPITLDIYKDNFYISYDGRHLYFNDFEDFYPLTEETFFQYSTLYDIHDLTLFELNLIMKISLEIPYYEM